MKTKNYLKAHFLFISNGSKDINDQNLELKLKIKMARTIRVIFVEVVIINPKLLMCEGNVFIL